MMGVAYAMSYRGADLDPIGGDFLYSSTDGLLWETVFEDPNWLVSETSICFDDAYNMHILGRGRGTANAYIGFATEAAGYADLSWTPLYDVDGDPRRATQDRRAEHDRDARGRTACCRTQIRRGRELNRQQRHRPLADHHGRVMARHHRIAARRPGHPQRGRHKLPGSAIGKGTRSTSATTPARLAAEIRMSTSPRLRSALPRY